MMVTLRADAKFGFGGKQYIARITGRDKSYTFAREFVGRKEGKRGEDSVFETDEPGLYLCCDIDRKGNKEERFRLILADGDDLKIVKADKEEALAIGKALDEGRSIEQIVADVDFENHTFVILTKAAAERSNKGKTIDAAVSGCLAILEAFPEKEAKKILSALRAAILPKPVATEAPAIAEEQPVPEAATTSEQTA